MKRLRPGLMALAAASLLSFACVLSAGSLAVPAGRVVLTVIGAIENHNEGSAALFDLASLAALDATRIETTTPWTEGLTAFTGVSFARLLETVGASGDTLVITALNDYSATVKVADLVEAGAILAYRMNGKRMSVRDKGPLWVMFPFDTDARYRTDAYWGMSVWQVRDIRVQ